MFDMSNRIATIRRCVLAGVTVLGMGGVMTGAAQAFPVAPDVPAAGVAATQVQYDGGYRHHGYRDHRRHNRYGVNRHPRHPGHAGLYDCGPGGKATRLSRKACGGNDRFMHTNRF